MSELRIRRLEGADSLESLTDLLHRAYAKLATMGFRYLATYQDVETTRRRIAKGECYLAVERELVLGTILVIQPKAMLPLGAGYDRSDAAILSQFAVEPARQRQGIGGRLLDFGEQRAAELGAREVSVDTAEGATHLLELYEARGYRQVGLAQWEHTNYRSVLLCKPLGTER